MVAHVHGGIHRQNEEPDPPQIHAAQQIGLGTHDQCKRFAVTELVIAPALKPTKDRVKTFIGVTLKLAKDGDVAGVANFLGQVGRVKNIFGLEEGVSLGAFELPQIDAQIKVFERLVDETSMARLISCHVRHQLLDIRVIDVLANFVVQNAARKFRGE